MRKIIRPIMYSDFLWAVCMILEAMVILTMFATMNLWLAIPSIFFVIMTELVSRSKKLRDKLDYIEVKNG